jgi:DNA helicase HerA-like ATPase
MLRLGYTVDGKKSVELSLDERRQGTYIIGTTGTGKSTLLKNMIYQDMRDDKKHGICVLDPHGDLIDELLG